VQPKPSAPPNTTISPALSQTEALTVARRINNQPTWIQGRYDRAAVATITGTMSEAACPAAGNEPSTATAQLCAACGEALAMRNDGEEDGSPAEGQATASSRFLSETTSCGDRWGSDPKTCAILPHESN